MIFLQFFDKKRGLQPLWEERLVRVRRPRETLVVGERGGSASVAEASRERGRARFLM